MAIVPTFDYAPLDETMFPTERIGIEHLERNPAPGTEHDPPQPAFTIDVRALAKS